MYVKPTAPRSIGGVLDDGLRLWRNSIARTWQLVLLAQLLVAIPLLLYRIQFKDAPIAPAPNALAAMSAANAQFFMAMAKSPLFWLGYLLAAVLYLAIYNAIILRIFAVSTNSDLAIGQSLRTGVRFVAREILLALLTFVAAIVIGIALAVVAGFMAAGGAQRGLLPVLMFVFMLLTMGFFLTRLFLTLIALVVQNTRVFESLGVSWDLTRGNFWRCCAILTVLIVIGIVLSLVIGIVNGLMAVWLGVTGIATILLTQLLSLISGTILGSLYPAVSLAIFCDLKLRKEGADLAARVNALAAR